MSRSTQSDIVGNRYGKYFVLGFVPCASRHAKFECLCDCGNIVAVFGTNLIRGLSKSCGCDRAEITRGFATKHGHARVSMATGTYRTWQSILKRCNKPEDKNYKDYGGRGIKVCAEWHSFENFLADMGKKPIGTSIDRVDNSKGYYKENCRWANDFEQARNRRSTVCVCYKGEIKSVVEVCQIENVSYRKVMYRRSKVGSAILALIYFGVDADFLAASRNDGSPKALAAYEQYRRPA